ncbi:restriction endonuclease [Kitasatospora purpeofusca]|uniref:restriction endonuclease n=1 Tax=Kitasatospora purpeofusca TaxID=67352 RepID=UPI00225080B9|nr:restriction endonuclease [Kitasatospora purpeofusca]MCX4759259.1 restriction endonuclease [Kitasatospora purpeofusca]WSR30342.1 restriction endonuclease [Kitasatospora purpeofusca]WSR38577.1 restriction endonuclease [Kitasatospora purpeofusca]
MAGRRNNGVLAVWAEAQRQEQRREEARWRAQAAEQRRWEREQREAQKTAARGEREAQRAYQQSREAEAARRTAELDGRVEELRGLLAAGLDRPAFRAQSLLAPRPVPPFEPGRLGEPVPMPDQARYQVPPPDRAQARNPGVRQQYEQYVAQARARFEQDWYAAQAAEAERQRRLGEYHGQYLEWVARFRREDEERAARTEESLRRLRSGEAEAVQEYFSAVLYASAGWPEGFPHRLVAAWEASSRQLVVNWELPGPDVVPATGRVRYVKADDREAEVARPATERKALYREVLAQSALRVVTELYRADGDGLLASVVLNGFVRGIDPATGREAERFLTTVTVDRAEFSGLTLDRVAAVECFQGLGGVLSARPERLDEVRPDRLPETVGGSVAGQGGEDDPDLFEMDPIEFEELIAELFRLRGFRVMTTARSGDAGVDVVAEDLDPVTGGRIVIQAKRYRSTVSPTAVRDLDSTVRHHGAIKGILVTTAGFGPGSYEYIRNKPLTLVSGPELVELLAEQGLRGRLGERTSGGGANGNGANGSGSGNGANGSGSDGSDGTGGAGGAGSGSAAAGTSGAVSTVALSWGSRTAGGDPVELDVSAFLCANGRVLDDEHFVFFNNPQDPDGAVRLHPTRSVPGEPVRRAELTLDTARLAPAVDEVVVAVSTEEEESPTLPLGYVHGLALGGAFGPDVTGPARWEAGTGGVPESAMVVGSFQRRGGVWTFEPSGTPVPGGLAGLAVRWGVAVE